jgi:hypothetical protein
MAKRRNSTVFSDIAIMKALRGLSLEKSCEELPTNLLLIRKDENNSELRVIAHAKLCIVSDEQEGLLVESGDTR